jgi:hypothetical protein
MSTSEQCQTGKCNECPGVLANAEQCAHGCHLNTVPVSKEMDERLKEQRAKQDKIEPITPNEPHIA